MENYTFLSEKLKNCFLYYVGNIVFSLPREHIVVFTETVQQVENTLTEKDFTKHAI